MFDIVEQKAKTAARKVALSAAGGLALIVGLGFLTVAAWIYLVAIGDALIAASVIGTTYAGFGLVALAMSSARPTQAATPTVKHSPAQDAPPLMQAFLYGMQAGSKAQSPH